MTDLWQLAKHHLDEGNFTALQDDLGGPEAFDRDIVGWFGVDKFAGEPDMLAEALSCACMLGRTTTAEYLIENGVEVYVGMKTGLAGPHYAVSGGHLETVRMLLSKNVDLEVKNMYGGTIWGQALWSAVYEPKASHPEIIEMLLAAGAKTEPGTMKWWSEQDIPTDRKQEIGSILERYRVK